MDGLDTGQAVTSTLFGGGLQCIVDLRYTN